MADINENPELVKKINSSLDEISTLLSRKSDKDFILEFLKCLFTKAEMEEMAKRWILVRELDQGVTQREIAKKYNMSLCKITRGSRELKKEDSAFRKMLDIYKSSVEGKEDK